VSSQPRNTVRVEEEVVVVQVSAAGPQGPKGDQGSQGVQGPQGPQGPQGIPGLDGVGAPVYGQVAKMTSGTISIGTQGVYQSTGLLAILDADNAGISLGTTDTFAVKNTSGFTRRLKISASYDASMAGSTKQLGLALAINGVTDLDTECRATTGLPNAIAKLNTAWIIDLPDGQEVAMRVANFTSADSIQFQRGRIVATSVAGFGPQGPQGPVGPVGPVGGVDSVNSQTGVVVLTASDVGAYPDTNPSSFVDAAGAAAAAPVQSVNSQAGTVVLTASSVGAYPDTNPSNFIDAAGAPVQSVNSQSGTVVLTASNVGAYPDTNPSAFVDAAGAALAAPVQSVNSQSGTVVLAASDVGAAPTSRQINTSGTGLSGGGDLSTDRTISLDPTALAGDSAFAALGGIPTGGTTGQVLAKNSGTNYDTVWGAPQLAGGAARPLNPAGAFLDGSNGLVLAGLAGNYARTPDSAALDITGDLDIRMKMRPAVAWNVNSLIGVTKNGAYGFWHTFSNINGQLTLNWREGGVTRVANSTVAVSANLGTAASTGWVRATLDVDNGASGRDITFFTSTDGTNWTQLGTTVTQAGVTSVDVSANEVRFGNVDGFGGFNGNGQLFRAQVLDGIGGTTVLDAEFEAAPVDALAFTESSANTAPVTLVTTRYTVGIPNTGFYTIGTETLAVNQDYFEPFIITAPTVVDMLAFEVTTAPSSASTVHAAIYAADGNQQPTGAPLASWGPITVATSTTGVYSTQITPVTLQPGTYVLGYNQSVAFTVRVYRHQTHLLHTLGGSAILTRTVAARTNAAFPNPSAGWNTYNTSSVGRSTFALLRWRPA
jgi:hypothetical protein